MDKIKDKLPGVLLCFCIAIPAWFLGKAVPVIGGPVFGIIFGMLLALLKRPLFLEGGIKYTSKKLLQYSIILLGFEMNLYRVIQVGGQSLLVILFTISTSFLVAYLVGRTLKMSRNVTILVGVGTSICGGSAIAATAPVLGAQDDEVARCISTIFLFNVIAVFIFPALGHLIGLGDMGFGMWAGTAINDTSSVVAASASWSNSAGNNTALQFATIVKLTRTLMIVPITLGLAVYTSRTASKNKEKHNFRFAKTFPWFVVFFVLAAVLNTFFGLPQAISHNLIELGKFVIIMAMTAIGLNTNLKRLILNGFQPIFLGLCCWFSVAAVSLLVQRATNMW